jgi:hypothetical protein
MNELLADMLEKFSSPISDVHKDAAFQLAMILEKNSRPSDEDGFYESVLPQDMLAIELSEREQEELLTEIAKNEIPGHVTASFIWAVGRSSPKVGMHVLRRFLSEHPQIIDDPNTSYQAVIALENCLDHDEDESGPHAEDEFETDIFFDFLRKASSSSNERIAEHCSRLLERLETSQGRSIKSPSILHFKSKPVSTFDYLVDEPFDLMSPCRSTVPLLAYWFDFNARLVEFGNAISLPISNHASLDFEYRVSPPQGKGKASHTDLMIRDRSSVIAIEAKYTELESKSVFDWLGKPITENRMVVLEGWLRIISKATGCEVTADKVQDFAYQLIHRTASACLDGVEHRAVVYQYFDPVERLRKYYSDQLQSLASLIAAPRRLSFYLYMTTLSKTIEYAQLQADWLRIAPRPDLSDAVRKLLKERKVAVFSEPAVLRF